MFKRNKRRLATSAAALLALSLLAACGEDDGGGDEPEASGSNGGGSNPCHGETITMPIAAGWDEDIVTTYLWKHVLEQKGCEVEVQSMDIGVAFQGLAGGDQDLFLDVWLPNTHADYVKKFGDDMEEIGTWYKNASLELTVPTYVDADSIADLAGMADEFDGEITGIDPGAGLTRLTQDSVMPEYGLDDYELKISSTATMLTELKSAVEAKEPIVVTLWHPHRAYAQWDLKDLEDPKGAFGEGETIKAYARAGFSEDFPEIAEAVGNWTMDDKTLIDLEKTALLESDDPEAGVVKWAEANQDYVSQMMP